MVSSEGDDGKVEARGEAMVSRIWKRSRGITVILGGLVLKMIIIIGAVSRTKLPKIIVCYVLCKCHLFFSVPRQILPSLFCKEVHSGKEEHGYRKHSSTASDAALP